MHFIHNKKAIQTFAIFNRMHFQNKTQQPKFQRIVFTLRIHSYCCIALSPIIYLNASVHVVEFYIENDVKCVAYRSAQ